MKTAENLLHYLLGCFEIELYELKESNPELVKNAIKLIQDDRKEAIKADRVELAKLVNKRLENESEVRAFLIDGSSIINAPNIILD